MGDGEKFQNRWWEDRSRVGKGDSRPHGEHVVIVVAETVQVVRFDTGSRERVG